MSLGGGILGLGMHLALEHHDGPHGEDHGLEIVALARAATHGHPHDAAAAPDHDHASIVNGSVLAQRPGAHAVAVFAIPAAPAPATRAERFPLVRSSRGGPPVPLFTAHCSLLL